MKIITKDLISNQFLWKLIEVNFDRFPYKRGSKLIWETKRYKTFKQYYTDIYCLRRMLRVMQMVLHIDELEKFTFNVFIHRIDRHLKKFKIRLYRLGYINKETYNLWIEKGMPIEDHKLFIVNEQ